MDYEKEIPFGAFDSELMHEEISIPEGFEATIEGNKIILKKIESEDEKVRKELIDIVTKSPITFAFEDKGKVLAWLEKQGEQKPTQEIEPFEAEHGKYYYCIKDYFCGGRKQASKGDVVQALRGLPIMGLKDASEYFLPVNSIKCNSAWTEDDEIVEEIIDFLDEYICSVKPPSLSHPVKSKWCNWLNSLKRRIRGEQ